MYMRCMFITMLPSQGAVLSFTDLQVMLTVNIIGVTTGVESLGFNPPPPHLP